LNSEEDSIHSSSDDMKMDEEGEGVDGGKY